MQCAGIALAVHSMYLFCSHFVSKVSMGEMDPIDGCDACHGAAILPRVPFPGRAETPPRLSPCGFTSVFRRFPGGSGAGEAQTSERVVRSKVRLRLAGAAGIFGLCP